MSICDENFKHLSLNVEHKKACGGLDATCDEYMHERTNDETCKRKFVFIKIANKNSLSLTLFIAFIYSVVAMASTI